MKTHYHQAVYDFCGNSYDRILCGAKSGAYDKKPTCKNCRKIKKAKRRATLLAPCV